MGVTEPTRIMGYNLRGIKWELRKIGVLTISDAFGKDNECNICNNPISNISHFSCRHPEIWKEATDRAEVLEISI